MILHCFRFFQAKFLFALFELPVLFLDFFKFFFDVSPFRGTSAKIDICLKLGLKLGYQLFLDV